MTMRRLLAALLLPVALAACGADRTWAPDEEVTRAAFVSGEPPSITLFTVIRKSTGAGAHSGLMIDAGQRIMYDPAGTWYHPTVPVRHDVHYGISERMRKFYIDYHARETFDVLEQKVFVSREVAEIAVRRAQQQGAAPKAFCGNAVTSILRGVPGFESIPVAFNPSRISKAFGRLPGVTSKVHEDGDPDNNSGVLLVQKGQT